MRIWRTRRPREFPVAYRNKDAGMSGDFVDLPELPFVLYI